MTEIDSTNLTGPTVTDKHKLEGWYFSSSHDRDCDEGVERCKQELDKDQGSERGISSNPRSENSSDKVFYIGAVGDEVDYLCCQGWLWTWSCMIWL
jgi:hypothetical protein